MKYILIVLMVVMFSQNAFAESATTISSDWISTTVMVMFVLGWSSALFFYSRVLENDTKYKIFAVSGSSVAIASLFWVVRRHFFVFVLNFW
jgi:hypothetical protein